MSTANMEPKVDTINWVLTTLAAVVLVLRVSGKDRRRTPLWWDDHIIFVSWTLLLALTVTCAFAAHMHDDNSNNSSATTQLARESFSLAEAIASTIAIAVASLSKTGFAATLLHTSTKSWRRAVAWATIIVINITAGMTGLMLWLRCIPIRKIFEVVNYGYCWPDGVMTATQVVNSSVSGLANIVLSLTAIYVVYDTTSRRGYRIGAWFCATLGISAGLASFTKAALMQTQADTGSSYISGNIMILGVVEAAMIIIAGSLPELRDMRWTQPKPVKYFPEEGFRNSKRNAILFEEDFQYVLQQYMEAGRKSFSHQPPSRRASVESGALSRTSMESRAREPTWWV